MKLKLPLGVIADEIGGITLAGVFLWLAATELTYHTTLTIIAGIYLVVTGLLLIARPIHRIGAALAVAALVVFIYYDGVINQNSAFAIRDIGLFGLALDILLTPHKRRST